MGTQTPPEGHDLFLSYRRLDAERVAPLVAALNARGVTVWQDASEIDDLASIQHAIDHGLAHARALLVWYSKDYNASRACQWELTTAYCAAQASGGDPRRRVLVVNPEASPGHIVLPELFDQLHLNAAVLSVDELAERIAARLADHAAGVPVEPLGSLRNLARPAWHGSAGLGSLRFVGRLREMWALHATLQAEQAAMLTGVGGAGRPGVLQVRGSGGMGKSLLAEEYALRFGAAYPGGVFWLRAFGYSDSDREMDPVQREGQRDSQILSIAMELGLHTHGLKMAEVRGLLRGHFGRAGQPFLWIVDDLPPIERTDALAPWLAPHELGRTLITTRARLIESIKPIDLQQLEPDEALRLLTRGQALSDEDVATARAICAELGCHALAIDVTAALIRRRGYAKVLENLRQPDRDALEFAATQFREALPNGHERSIAVTLLASLRELDEPARDLLRLASVLAAAPIPRELQWRTIGRADGLNDEDAQDVADPAAAQLVDTSLADEAGAAGDGAFTVHTLVVRTIRFHDGQPERVEALRAAAVEVLMLLMPDIEDWIQREVLNGWLAHARQVTIDAQNPQTVRLLGWTGIHDYKKGAYAQAHAALMRAATENSDEWKQNAETLNFMNHLGLVLLAIGDYDDAYHWIQQALKGRERHLGHYHPDTYSSRNSMFMVCYKKGDLDGARHWVDEASSYYDSPISHTAEENLALIYEAEGSLDIARRDTQWILEKRMRTLGQFHTDTLNTMNNLSRLLFAEGDFYTARYYAKWVKDIGPSQDHPVTLAAEDMLALIATNLGELEDARRLAENSLNTKQHLFGEECPATLKSKSILVPILQAQGDFESARRLIEQIFRTTRRVLGERHTDTTVAAWDYFWSLLEMQDFQAAQRLLESDLNWLLSQTFERLKTVRQQEVLAKVWIIAEAAVRIEGTDHPFQGDPKEASTLELKRISQTFQDQGDLYGAMYYVETIFNMSRTRLGDNHPHTLSSLNILNQILQAIGDTESVQHCADRVFSKNKRQLVHDVTSLSIGNSVTIYLAKLDPVGARRYAEQLLDTCRRVLGERHQNTTRAALHLFQILMAMEEPEPASQLLVNDLLWLLAEDPEHLGAAQRQIAGMVRKMIGGGADQD